MVVGAILILEVFEIISAISLAVAISHYRYKELSANYKSYH
jgi:hypothetical protein